MLAFHIDDYDFNKKINNLMNNIKHREPTMAGIAAELQSMTEDNFENESWGNQKWKTSRRAHVESGKTLQLTNILASSIQTRANNDFARIGTNMRYAAIHHVGGKIHAKNAPYLLIPTGDINKNGKPRFARVKQVTIPERPYLPINANNQLQSDGKERILDVVLDSLRESLR